MDENFEQFLLVIQKKFNLNFIQNKNYTFKSIEDFFEGYNDQLNFFCSKMMDLNLDSFKASQYLEFNMLFSIFLMIKFIDYNENQIQKATQLLNKTLKNMESFMMENQMFCFLLNLIRELKSKINKKSKCKSTIFEMLKDFSLSLQSDPTDIKCLNYLNLFDNCLNSFFLQKNKENLKLMKKMEIYFSDFNKVVIQIIFVKDLGNFIEKNKSENANLKFFDLITKILFSFFVIITENKQIHNIANLHMFETFKFLDNLLTNLKKNTLNDEIVLFLMNSILNLEVIKGELLRIYIPESNLLKEILFFLEEKQFNRKENNKLGYSSKFLINLIKKTEYTLNKTFNSSYFEEIFLMLDEYVLHLIEPAFGKVFSILGENEGTWFEKRCINFLIRKSLSHK